MGAKKKHPWRSGADTGSSVPSSGTMDARFNKAEVEKLKTRLEEKIAKDPEFAKKAALLITRWLGKSKK